MKIISFALAALPFFLFSQNVEHPANSGEKGVNPVAGAGLRPESGTTRAVVIGISDYQEKDIPDLRFADRDAEAFANFLRSSGGGSISAENLRILTNQQATAGQVIAALTWLLDESKPGDQAIIYFSGHGDVEAKLLNQLGFLLLWDSPAHVYLAGALPVDMLRQVVSTLSIELKTKVFVVVDACRAGKLAGNSVIGTQLTSSQLAQQFSQEQKILSCQPNEFSIEGEQWGGGRGVFSWHLCNGLYGLADGDRNGQVSLFEIGRYLEDRVPQEVLPLSQLPLTVGDKTAQLFSVDGPTLAALQKMGTPPAVIARVEQRGMLQEVLAKADSSVRFWYAGFERSLRGRLFFEPESDCAEFFFQKLIQTESIAALHPGLNRNYAAALQDDAQQVLNIMLKSGLTSEVLSADKAAVTYRNYPAYLDRAAELLGSGHYMYTALKARKHYFEGTLQTTRRERKQQFFQALQWQADMPHAYAGLIGRYPAAQADSAEHYAARAMQIAPAWVKPYIELSLFYDRAMQPDKAEEALNRASQVDSGSILVWYQKGLFYRKHGNFDEAEHWYKKAIAASGDGICFPCAHNGLGLVHHDAHRYDEAEQHYKKAIQLDSTFAHAHINLGTVYWNTRRYAEAEQQCKKAIQLDSTFAQAYSGLGNIYLDTRRYDESEQQYKKTIQLDSTYTLAYNGLGTVYWETSRFDEAEQQYKKTIQLDSTYVFAYSNLGNVYADTRRYAEAEQQYKKAIQFDSTNATAHYNLACLQSQQNRMDAAFDYLGKALKNGYKDYDWLQQDGDLAPLREQKDRWETLMKNAIVPDPTDAKAWNMLGQVHIRARNYAPAAAAFRKAVALNATSAPFHSNLGFVYLNLGRYAEAEAALKKAIALDSAFANPRKHLGMVCFKTKRPGEARQNFLKALELNPKYAPAHLGMAYLSAEALAKEDTPASAKASAGKEALEQVEQAILKKATFEQLESDEDLAPLRALPEWKVLMKKHFPDKVKD